MRFIETIRIENGAIVNMELHKQRMQQTTEYFFNKPIDFKLSAPIIPNEYLSKRLVYRIEYGLKIYQEEWSEYRMRKINSLQMVEDNSISYAFKYANREQLHTLLRQKKNADEIIVVQNGLITDTSFSNLVFETKEGKLITPSNYLLNGTKRQLLIKQGIVDEQPIRVSELSLFRKVFLVNALVDLSDNLSIKIEDIYF